MAVRRIILRRRLRAREIRAVDSEDRKIVCSRCCQHESIYQRRSIGMQHISETMMALAVLWDLDAHVDQEVYLASEYEG